MLSAATHLVADRERHFAALRVTRCDSSHCQGLFFTIEPSLNKISWICAGVPEGRSSGGSLCIAVDRAAVGALAPLRRWIGARALIACPQAAHRRHPGDGVPQMAS